MKTRVNVVVCVVRCSREEDCKGFRDEDVRSQEDRRSRLSYGGLSKTAGGSC